MGTRRVVVGAATVAVAALAVLIGPTASAAVDGTFGDPAPAPSLSSPDRDRFFASGAGAGSSGAEGSRAITVTPDTALVDGQAVTVDGSGFGGDGITGIFQCAKGMGVDGCDFTSVVIFSPDANTFSRPFHVTAILDTEAGDIDCRTHVDGCRLAANDAPLLSGAARADLHFDPDGPLEPPPTVAADPATDLVDGQVIQVTGSDFRPDETVLVGQCPAGADELEVECQNLYGLTADADGTIDTPYQVEAAFEVYRFEEGFGSPVVETIDCRSEPCELFAVAIEDFDRHDTVPLEFDPDAPLRPDMNVTVVPNSDLVDDQTVAVSAVGYTPDGPVTVVQCSIVSNLDGEGCELDRVQELTADADGAVATTYDVNDVLDTESGPVDCVRNGSCILVAVDRSVPIDFGRGYRFESLHFAGGDLPGPTDPADPIAVQPAFTG